MGENQASQWRRKQRIESKEEIDVSDIESMFRERDERQRRARESQIFDEMRYSTTSRTVRYSRTASQARDAKGSIRGEKVRTGSIFPKRRLLAILLATGLTIGVGANLINNQKPEEVSTLQMQEAGIDLNKLGLTPELIEQLRANETFFDEYDSKVSISEEEVLAKIDEIDQLKEDVLRQKLAYLFHVSPEEVGKPDFGYTREAERYAGIDVGDIRLSDNFLPIFQREDLPKDIVDLLFKFDDLESLASKVREDKVTKDRAIEILGDKYFEDVELLANATFVKDEHNNVTVAYSQIKEVQEQAEQAEQEAKQAEKEKNQEGKSQEDDGEER